MPGLVVITPCLVFLLNFNDYFGDGIWFLFWLWCRCSDRGYRSDGLLLISIVPCVKSGVRPATRVPRPVCRGLVPPSVAVGPEPRLCVCKNCVANAASEALKPTPRRPGKQRKPQGIDACQGDSRSTIQAAPSRR